MASIADLRPGWHQLDADILIDEAGNATLCEPLPDDEPIAGLGTSRCPADAPAVDPIDIGELDAMRLMSPLVVHVNRSEEHTSELQSLMRIYHAVFCLK